MPQFKTRIVSPPVSVMTLKLEHWSDELSPAQRAYYSRAEREYNDITSRVHDLIRTKQADVIEAGEEVMLLQLNGTTINTTTPVLKNASTIPMASIANQTLQTTSLQSQPVLLQAPPALCPTGSAGNIVSTVKSSSQTTQFGASGGTIQLVMSPRLGLIVGQVPGQDGQVSVPVASSSGSIAQRNAVQSVAVPTQPMQGVPSQPIPPPIDTRPPQPNQPPRTLSLARVAKVSPLAQQSFISQPFPQATSTGITPKITFSVTPAPTLPPASSQNIPGKPRIVSSTSLATCASSSTITTNSTKTVTATITPNILCKTSADKTTAPPKAPTTSGIRISSSLGAVPPSPVKEQPPPTESSSPPTPTIRIASTVGGVSTTEKPIEEVNTNAVVPDSREVAFNKVAGKTFPSLVVLARPHLKDKEMSPQFISKERAMLDAQVKSVLIFSPTKFTEWLIQQGLVRSEQVCPVHTGPDGKPTKLKLGMYSDVSKFPFSGGYVWISDCCPHRFVSVFSGSIFEGSPHPPSTLLKLMYHWCCQTNVQNVVHWVKVDNFYVKNFYTNMRTICTAAVHEKYEKMGGKDKTIEVGVISLGTTSQGGNMRQVKVEVLGVMDPESKRIRLRAVEPLQDGERVYKRRFIKILEPLENWVDKDSIIVTDFTVDKSTLQTMGFRHVFQVSLNETQPKNTRGNHNVMEYLRRIVPRMFQNTLSLLSRQIIQQFLDELVWRERWGSIPVEAFNNLILHLSQQTKLNSGESLLLRLARIASNPFRDWRYSNWVTPVSTLSGTAPPLRPIVPAGTARTPALAPLSNVPRAALTITPAGSASITNAVTSSSDTPNVAVGPNARNVVRKGAAAGELNAIQHTAEGLTMGNNSSSSFNGPRRVSPESNSEDSVDSVNDSMLIKKSHKLVPLEEFYYANKPGNPGILKKEFKCETLNAKCCICQKVFASNIDVMQHIMAHSLSWETYREGEENSLEEVTNRMCRYCLGLYTHPSRTIAHADEVHRHLDYRPTCLICEMKFRDRQSLIAHMHRFHVESEMPYRCGICDFRSSEKRVVIDHFYDLHSQGEELQCPFCLRCVALSRNGRKINANAYFFYNHVRKHQLKYLSRTCNRCALTFVHKDLLKEHQSKDHKSSKDVPDVVRYPESNEATQLMMPLPPTLRAEQLDPATEKVHATRQKRQLPSFTSRPLNVHNIDAYEDDACLECQYSLLKESHFTNYLTCLWCRYATCCTKAMEVHSQNAHSKEKTECYPTTTVLMLSEPLYCPCAFNSNNTNSLAKHLGQCIYSILYPSKELADAAAERAKELAEAAEKAEAEEEAATRPLLSMTEDVDDRNVSPNVLNMLGLIQKPLDEEDETSRDEAPLLERMVVSRNGRKRGRPSSISSSESRKRRRTVRNALYREMNDSDTESVDDVVSIEGSEDSWGTDSMRSASRQRKMV